MSQNIPQFHRKNSVLPTSASSSGEMIQETNEVEMEMSDSGIYHCTLRVPLQRKMGKDFRLGPVKTLKTNSNQRINELLIYSGIFP